MITLRLPPLLVVRTQSMPRAHALPPSPGLVPESACTAQRSASYATPDMPRPLTAAPARPATAVPCETDPPWVTSAVPSNELNVRLIFADRSSCVVR
jgi:hypothetical protein